MKNSLLIFTFMLFGSYSPTLAQTEADRLKNIKAALPAIDAIFKNFAEQNHFPSLAYCLVVDGKMIHTGNLGSINLAKKNAATSKSVYRIASMTKSFAAMAIVKLRDEGKLKLDNPVSMYIPAMKGQGLTADSPEITIRHLLTHAAGFPEDNPWGDRQLAVSEQTMLDMIKKGISFSNSAGIAYEYSNMGFAMLGYIVKKVSGQPYQTYISKNIFEPLGMNSTYWEYSKVPANELVSGYLWLGEQWIEQPMLADGAYGAMGGMLTSIEDFSKYIALNLAAYPPRDDKENSIVKRSSIREMHQASNFSTLNPTYQYPNGRVSPLISAYGYGLRWTKDGDGKLTIGHSGGLPGFGSNWKIMPDYGIGIVSFANLTYASASYLNTQVLDTLISLAKLQPKPLPISPILNQRKNELLSLLPAWENATSKGIFAENFFLDYFPDLLKKEAKAIFDKAGKIIQVGEIVPENNLRGAFVIFCENADIEVSFTLTPENPPLIQEYNIKELPKN